jgi:hypothetical protein
MLNRHHSISRITFEVFSQAVSGVPDDRELEKGRATENDGLPQDASEGFTYLHPERNLVG